MAPKVVLDITTPERGAWVVLDEGPLRDQPLQVLTVKPGARGPALELRLPDGRTWSVPAQGLGWRDVGEPV